MSLQWEYKQKGSGITNKNCRTAIQYCKFNRETSCVQTKSTQLQWQLSFDSSWEEEERFQLAQMQNINI